MSSNNLQALMDKMSVRNQTKIEELNLMGTTDSQQQEQVLDEAALEEFSDKLDELSKHTGERSESEKREISRSHYKRLYNALCRLLKYKMISESDFEAYLDRMKQSAEKNGAGDFISYEGSETDFMDNENRKFSDFLAELFRDAGILPPGLSPAPPTPQQVYVLENTPEPPALIYLNPKDGKARRRERRAQERKMKKLNRRKY